MKRLAVKLCLILTFVLFPLSSVLADNSPWAQHKANSIPDWVIYGGTAWIILIFVFLIMPSYINRPLIEWWNRRKQK